MLRVQGEGTDQDVNSLSSKLSQSSTILDQIMATFLNSKSAK